VSTCDTCAHWLRPEKRNGFGNAVKFEDDEWNDDLAGGLGGYVKGDTADRLFGECQGVPFGDALTGPPPLAAIRDGSDYKADLFTQAKFGCVLHAALDRYEGDA
jgi:hypothetical protein